MNEVDRNARNDERITELFPTFGARLRRVIQRLEADGLRPRIQDAWRSPEDQLKAFQSGHSKLRFGFHNVTGPGGRKEALAVDLLDDDAPLNPRKAYILKLAAAAQAEGLSTGVRWGLVKKLRAGIDAAIAAQDWSADVKIGWDPVARRADRRDDQRGRGRHAAGLEPFRCQFDAEVARRHATG